MRTKTIQSFVIFTFSIAFFGLSSKAVYANLCNDGPSVWGGLDGTIEYQGNPVANCLICKDIAGSELGEICIQTGQSSTPTCEVPGSPASGVNADQCDKIIEDYLDSGPKTCNQTTVNKSGEDGGCSTGEICIKRDTGTGYTGSITYMCVEDTGCRSNNWNTCINSCATQFGGAAYCSWPPGESTYSCSCDGVNPYDICRQEYNNTGLTGTAWCEQNSPCTDADTMSTCDVNEVGGIICSCEDITGNKIVAKGGYSGLGLFLGVVNPLDATNSTAETPLGEFLDLIYDILLPLGIVLGLFMIAKAGFGFMGSQGDPGKVEEARNDLTSAIIGTLFIMFGTVILRLLIRILFNTEI